MLNSLDFDPTKDYENNYLLGSYYFAKKIVDGDTVRWEYYNSQNDASIGNYFSGTFDGQGHIITGLSDVGYTPFSTAVYANSVKVLKGYTFGLFGLVSGNVTVKNVSFEDVQIIGAYYDTTGANPELVLAEIDSAGAAIGFVASNVGNLVIDNVKVLSGSLSGNDAIGGIVGRAYNRGTMAFINLENRANVTSKGHTGGIVAYASFQTIDKVTYRFSVLYENNTNYGNINSIGSGKYAGAMSNYFGSATTDFVKINNCRNFGNISGMYSDVPSSTLYGMISGVNGVAGYDYTNCQNYGVLTKK